MKTAELEGAALDAAVAMALGMTGMFCLDEGKPICCVEESDFDGLDDWVGDGWAFTPSVCWNVGGPIIERERITVVRMHRVDEEGYRHGVFCAWSLRDDDGDNGAGTYFDVTPGDAEGEGSTYLIAAMRAFVASKLGEEVELP